MPIQLYKSYRAIRGNGIMARISPSATRILNLARYARGIFAVDGFIYIFDGGNTLSLERRRYFSFDINTDRCNGLSAEIIAVENRFRHAIAN